MPGYSSRESMSAMSMSLADLNFDPEPHQRRARTTRSKRDALSQSCSAFNFVLDPSELAQTAEENHNGKSKSSRRRTAGSKPSYSDLVMDATAKTLSSAQLESPTSPLEEIRERKSKKSDAMVEESTNDSYAKEEGSSAKKPSRSIPSNAEFNRQRNRSSNLKPKSCHTELSSGPSSTPRRSRKPRSTGHMSVDSFPEPEAFLTATPEPAVKKKAHRSSVNERFSKSFSDFGGWDFNNEDTNTNNNHVSAEVTTMTPRRRGKKPLRAKSSCDGLEKSPSRRRASMQDTSLTDLDLFAASPSRNHSKTRRKSSIIPKSTTEKFSRSFGDLDFSSEQNLGFLPKQLSSENLRVEHEPHPVDDNTDKPKRRSRSKDSSTRQPQLQRSLSRRRQSNENEEIVVSLSPIRKPRSKRGSEETTTRGPPPPRLRRSHTADGSISSSTLRAARSNHDSKRTSSQDDSLAVPRTSRRRASEIDASTFAAAAVEPQHSRGNSRSRTAEDSPRPVVVRRVSRRASDANVVADAAVQEKRRVPRRAKSGDQPPPTSLRRPPQRSLSSDSTEGSHFARRASKSYSAGIGLDDEEELVAEIRQSPRRTPAAAAAAAVRPGITRSMSGHGERRVVRRGSRKNLGNSLRNLSATVPDPVDRSVVSGSSNEDSTGSGSGKRSPVPRRKLPTRSKSHDGSSSVGGGGGGGGIARMPSTRDRLRSHMELKAASRMREQEIGE